MGMFSTGGAIGGVVGTVVAGPAGGLAGQVFGGLIEDAYSRKPVAQQFATTVRNDLAPENVVLDAHQIYVRITSGHGSESLEVALAAASRLASGFADRVSQIAAVRNATAQAWQGGASTAAGAATAPLSDGFAVAQRQLEANSRALNTELAAFHHIRSQVEFVPETPPQSGILNAINPFPSDLDAAINEYNAKAVKNVQLYEAYSAETEAARAEVPQSYTDPASLIGTAAAVTRTASPVGPTSATPPPLGSVADVGAPVTTTAASATPGGMSSATPLAGGAAGMAGGTTGQGFVATDPTGRQAFSPTSAPPAGAPAPRALSAAAFTGLPGATGPFAARGGAGAASPRTGGFSGGTGLRGTGAGVGGGVGSGGPGSVGGPGTRGGSPVGTGPTPGQTPAGQQLGRGGLSGPPTRGAAGPGGFPAGGPARGDGEEDLEHRTKYLIEPDSEELFGTGELCAPSVIGGPRR
jgi:hypothetical protein